MARPPIEVEGPYPPPVVIPWWLIPLGVFALCFIVGAVVRLKGLFV